MIKKVKSKSFVILLAVLVALILMALTGVMSLKFGVSNPGEFGDSFGVVNALFSGLALGGVIWAILLQTEELRLQRKELSETREEMEAQKLAIRRDAFERSFFELVKAIDDKYQTTEYRHEIEVGRYEASEIAKNHRERGKTVTIIGNTRLSITEKGEDAFLYASNDLAEKWPSIMFTMTPYFSLLFKVLWFIDRSDFSNEFEDKKFYISIIRDQRTQDEMQMLFSLLSYPDWHFGLGHGEINGELFKQIVEKYSFFLNLGFPFYDKNPDLKRQLEFYDKNAFGKTEAKQKHIADILDELNKKESP